jgi:hypothetical protein
MRHEDTAAKVGLGQDIWQRSRMVNVETNCHGLAKDFETFVEASPS